MRSQPFLRQAAARCGPALAGILLVLASTLASPSHTAPSAAPAQLTSGVIEISPDLHILSVEFGRVSPDRLTGLTTFTPTQDMTMTPGQGYGWRMRVKTTRQSIKWKEVLTLPTAPASWGIAPHVTLSLDRRIATSRSASTPQAGIISSSWIFVAGDPLGNYTMELEVEGVEVGRGTLHVHPF